MLDLRSSPGRGSSAPPGAAGRSVQSRRAITEIVGELAIPTCWEDKHKQRCATLRDNLKNEILAQAIELERCARETSE
jgi:hypothetical protein